MYPDHCKRIWELFISNAIHVKQVPNRLRCCWFNIGMYSLFAAAKGAKCAFEHCLVFANALYAADDTTLDKLIKGLITENSMDRWDTSRALLVMNTKCEYKQNK